jgi:hypothetical protein
MNGLRPLLSAALIGSVGLSMALAVSPALAIDAQAPAPTPAVATQTTNSMLQQGDVPAVLGSASGINTGYTIPPGGQDPFPLCFDPGNYEVLPSIKGAIGYFSRADQVTQEIYVYPNPATAQAAWSVLDRQISRQCTFVDVNGKDRVRSRQGKLPDGSGRWVRMDLNFQESPAFYSAVGVVDNGIVITRFQGSKGLKQTTVDQRAAVDALFSVLAKRYAERSTLGPLQPVATTQAQMRLLQPGDIPASLPILQPANGAWADQSAQYPGNWPFNSCNPDKAFLPSGVGYFSQNLGSTGDVFAKTGMVNQQVVSYNDASTALAAWNVVNRTIKECNKVEGTLYAKGANFKTVTGVVDVSGMPGLFIRDIDTQNFGRGNRFVTKAYTVFTLSGDAIISVDYASSRMGMTRFTINESAVRDLTATAVQKWVPSDM